MWRTFTHAEVIPNLIHQPWAAGATVTLTIACLGAIIVLWRLRQASDGLPVWGVTIPRSPGIPRLKPISSPIQIFDDSSRAPSPSPHHASSRTDFSDMSPHAAHPSLGSVFSAFSAPPDPTRGQGLFASASEAPGDALTAPDGDNAPEDAIAPPIWRRVESLIEERRAAALALTGEALGEAALIEPAPPIWRSVTALRIEVAEMEGAPEAAEQEVAQAYAPTPPIWRMPERAPWRQSAGLALAFSPASSEHSSSHDDELIDLSALAGAPPIWLTWVSAAWPERYAPPEIEESSGADEPLVWSEPPIWRSPMRQR